MDGAAPAARVAEERERELLDAAACDAVNTSPSGTHASHRPSPSWAHTIVAMRAPTLSLHRTDIYSAHTVGRAGSATPSTETPNAASPPARTAMRAV